ncbi:anti-sigma factor antagonist [Streptomyces sp. NPDC004561]
MSQHAVLPPPCPDCGASFEQSSAPVALSVDMIGDGLVVTVTGELGLECDQLLRQALGDALDHAHRGLELDLAGVEFCDCAALNVLLSVRHRARASAKSFVLRATSPAVERLLTLTGTRALFTAGSADPEESPTTASQVVGPGAAERGEASSDGLAVENAQLHRALQTRATIDLARGMLMASFQLTAQQSWEVLVTASQHSNTKLHLIADALLQTTQGRPLPGPLAGHLATAVQAHGGPADQGLSGQ